MCLIFLSIALCTLSKSTIQIEKLINKIVINQVISYWPSYRSSASCIGPRLRLGPIQQTSDYDNIVNLVNMVNGKKENHSPSGNVYTHEPYFYTANLAYAFLIFDPKHRLWERVLSESIKISNFCDEIFHFFIANTCFVYCMGLFLLSNMFVLLK